MRISLKTLAVLLILALFAGLLQTNTGCGSTKSTTTDTTRRTIPPK